MGCSYCRRERKVSVFHQCLAMACIWQDHLRKQRRQSPRWCSRRFFCASTGIWSIFATFQMRFSGRTCRVARMSSRRRRPRLEMLSLFRLQFKTRNCVNYRVTNKHKHGIVFSWNRSIKFFQMIAGGDRIREGRIDASKFEMSSPFLIVSEYFRCYLGEKFAIIFVSESN